VLRLKPGLVRRLEELHAVMLQPAAQPKSVVFFRVAGGHLRGPATLSLEERVPSPVPLDARLQTLLDSLRAGTRPRSAAHVAPAGPPPPWEPLNLLARWYYSSFRAGELVMLPPSEEIPHARLIRLCRKMIQGQAAGR